MVRGMQALIFLTLITGTSWPLQLGIENTSLSFLNALTIHNTLSYRIGLITNQTALDHKKNRTVDILREKGLNIVYLLAPEHGFDGRAPAGKPIANSVDKKTGISIISIYGSGGDHTIAGKRINPAIMRQLDLLCYDIQDCGMRHYTYISTLLCALEAAAEYNKPLIVFDRPNFLGAYMEGPLVEPALKSFISIAPIPLRHGMTVGELALYFNKNMLPKPAKLHVVPMNDYKRTITPSFLQALSPNLTSLSSIYGYSFLGILGEIDPFDIGVNTPLAFQTIMLPDSIGFSAAKWQQVREILHKYTIKSTHHAMKGHKGAQCTGLRLRIADGKKVESFALLIELLSFFKQAGINLVYSKAFDKAVGTSKIRELSDHRKKEFLTLINNDLEQFFARAKDSYLYQPLPEIRKVA